MNSSPKDHVVEQRIIKALEIAVSNNGCEGLLLLNANEEQISGAAEVLSRLLSEAYKINARITVLHSFYSDDDIWGKQSFLKDFGLGSQVIDPEDCDTPLILLVPDLTLLNGPSARACVQIMDTPYLTIQRHGVACEWTQKIFVIAGCQSAKIGYVSLHILDRFLLRIPLPAEKVGNSYFRNSLNYAEDCHEGLEFDDHQIVLSIENLIRTKQRGIPPLDKEVYEKIIDFFPEEPVNSIRRYIGLARIIRGHARLDGSPYATQVHFQRSIQITGLSVHAKSKSIKYYRDNSWLQIEEAPAPFVMSPSDNKSDDAIPSAAARDDVQINKISPSAVFFSLDPFPEDSALVKREYAPLQIPFSLQRVHKGSRICTNGYCRSQTYETIALVPTILAALPFQKIRRKNTRSKNKFIICKEDLREWRSMPEPDSLLLLLIDFTSISGNQLDGLGDFLRMAYMRKSVAGVVSVGAHGSINELRSEKIIARNILSPEFSSALNREPGRATPLADGLFSAYKIMQDKSSKGRIIFSEILFIVISDGRGNVPFHGSRGLPFGPVGAEGIEDALVEANKIGHLKCVRSVVLDPQPPYLEDVVQKFADALNAPRIPLYTRTKVNEYF